jgi:hypothetical protein
MSVRLGDLRFLHWLGFFLPCTPASKGKLESVQGEGKEIIIRQNKTGELSG